MQIQFKHKYQVTIADLLWNAQDEKAVKLILKTFGKYGQEVYSMMIAENLDEVTETNLAEQELFKIFSKE
jgi:hypothetical protein